MANLRLFANLREAAGTATAAFPGDTVGVVVDAAVAAYGEQFAQGLETAKIWVNGDPAGADTAVAPSDEIALIPPVSGGETAAGSQTDIMRAVLVGTLLLSLVIANLRSTELFVSVAVAVAVAWLWDLRDAMALRRAPLEVIPVMAAAAAAANGAYGWGAEGLAGGLAVGLIVVLAWAILDRRTRSVEALAGAALLATAASVATGGLVLTRIRHEDEVTLFLVIATAAVLAAWLVGRFAANAAAIDPNVAGFITALVVGIIAGLALDTLSSPVTILVSVAVGAGFIAGRTLGSMTRTGAVLHTARAPGLLTSFDGPIIAAGLFWGVVATFG